MISRPPPPNIAIIHQQTLASGHDSSLRSMDSIVWDIGSPVDMEIKK
jgi:hypothetical protein